MANEIIINTTLRINKGSLKRNFSDSFSADMDGEHRGGGTIAVTDTPVLLEVPTELGSKGVGRFTNTSVNPIHIGRFDTPTFYGTVTLLAGESAVFRVYDDELYAVCNSSGGGVLDYEIFEA